MPIIISIQTEVPGDFERNVVGWAMMILLQIPILFILTIVQEFPFTQELIFLIMVAIVEIVFIHLLIEYIFIIRI